MTGIPSDGPIDPEEYVENVVIDVLGRRSIKMTVYHLLFMLAAIALTFGTKVFAVLALWHVPQWAVGIVVSVLVADLAWSVGRVRRRVLTHRADKQAARYLDNIDAFSAELCDARARLAEHKLRLRRNPGWWNHRPNWWIHRILDTFYVVCVGVVFTHWFGSAWVGVTVAAGWAALIAVIALWVSRTKPRILALCGFADPTAPKDTPEI